MNLIAIEIASRVVGRGGQKNCIRSVEKVDSAGRAKDVCHSLVLLPYLVRQLLP